MYVVHSYLFFTACSDEEIPFLTRYCHFILNNVLGMKFMALILGLISQSILYLAILVALKLHSIAIITYLNKYSKCAFLKPIALKLQIFLSSSLFQSWSYGDFFPWNSMETKINYQSISDCRLICIVTCINSFSSVCISFFCVFIWFLSVKLPLKHK